MIIFLQYSGMDIVLPSADGTNVQFQGIEHYKLNIRFIRNLVDGIKGLSICCEHANWEDELMLVNNDGYSYTARFSIEPFSESLCGAFRLEIDR